MLDAAKTVLPMLNHRICASFWRPIKTSMGQETPDPFDLERPGCPA
jgi:hypothetical protein